MTPPPKDEPLLTDVPHSATEAQDATKLWLVHRRKLRTTLSTHLLFKEGCIQGGGICAFPGGFLEQQNKAVIWSVSDNTLARKVSQCLILS